MELHVFIEVFAPVPDAYLRMAHAMEEVKKFLFPVSLSAACSQCSVSILIIAHQLRVMIAGLFRRLRKNCQPALKQN